MRDPYTPPESPPKELRGTSAVKRPASVTWAMVICWLWLLATYPVYRLARNTGRFDWLLIIIVLTVLSALTISFIAPRSRLRQKALAAVYVICMLRMAQSILVTLKHATSNLPISSIVTWLLMSTLFMWGILSLLSGSAAARYFTPNNRS